jgi:hypothetical protein
VIWASEGTSRVAFTVRQNGLCDFGTKVTIGDARRQLLQR